MTDGSLYWLGLGTLLAVLAIAIWQIYAARRAQLRHHHSTVGPHEGRTEFSSDGIAGPGRTRQP